MDKRLILIVEDDPKVGESLRLLLKKRGSGILLAANGKEALSLFRQEVVDLVITDLVMPKMGGLDLLRAIQHCLSHWLQHAHVAVNVLDRYGRVVHQDADGQRQAAQSHDVYGLSEQAEHADRG